MLVVTQYFWPEDFRINELVSELIRRGHEITILTGKPNYPDGRVFAGFLAEPAAFSSYQGARVLRVPMRPRGKSKWSLLLNYVSYALSATLFGILWLRQEHYDAILVFEPSPVTVGLPAVALGRLKGCPIAFWVLDQWPETLSALGVVKSKITLRLIGRLVSFIYAHCDLILAPSRGLVTLIGNYTPDRDRIAYFPNWAESAYCATEVTAAPEVESQPGLFNVMFAGNVGEAQNFPAILDAADRLKCESRIRWLVVGDGRMAQWVGAEVQRRGLQENVVLLGRFALDRMPSIYRHADALLVSLKPDPMFSRAIPGKIQSYLAFGVPVIAMLDGEGAAVIEAAEAGWTCPAGDSVKLAEIVVRMAGLPDNERRAMGARGKAYARREFDRDGLITKLEGMLANLGRT